MASAWLDATSASYEMTRMTKKKENTARHRVILDPRRVQDIKPSSNQLLLFGCCTGYEH